MVSVVTYVLSPLREVKEPCSNQKQQPTSFQLLIKTLATVIDATTTCKTFVNFRLFLGIIAGVRWKEHLQQLLPASHRLLQADQPQRQV